jgi:hypothetical protein
MYWKELGRTRLKPSLKYYPSVWLKEIRKFISFGKRNRIANILTTRVHVNVHFLVLSQLHEHYTTYSLGNSVQLKLSQKTEKCIVLFLVPS